ncbi:MAG: heavy-metal-associated domain-containing protein, partial [Nocardioidaceae bacterium]|nr:heavy-metal-associated domain-containing protein [Nocardioidaceae bacterium]
MSQQTFQQTFQVTGMTCGHCVSAVEEEVGAIADVTDVTVDLASGRV